MGLPQEEIYREGYNREDVFAFRWSMSGNDVNLALRHVEPHRADICFCGAYRTNSAGYAEDKWQSLSLEPGRDAKKLPSSEHMTLYFQRRGDAGEAAFDERFFFEYRGDSISKYAPQQPTGSRGDVWPKGRRRQGEWTIEFACRLNTGNDDDIAFAPDGVYLFGVACYAMVFDTPPPEVDATLASYG